MTDKYAVAIEPAQSGNEYDNGWLARIETVGGRVFTSPVVFETRERAYRKAEEMAKLYNAGVSMMNDAERGEL